ncbi:MAG TPA: hypothetical protein VFE82_04630 [Ramlibacter sp.]|jgi:hypothetical protein|uniref:hypothetical protein n=1 Tax=Ramlibacter sp. TaxID=1917967 RepID=UPI002D2EF457|nr:hypothetical protein [Ramlibacter sp.]HZY17742.1 hypothetical protein [Ramlibacter sp.]
MAEPRNAGREGQPEPLQPEGAPAADTGQESGGGEIKDKEAETSNSYGNTRDSGERPK